jgi:hypothetical protein
MPWWGWLLLVLATPFLVCLAWLAWALCLLAAVWIAWVPRGRHALIVYSASPIWQGYCEATLLPAVGSRAAVLNWSERRRWGWSLPVLLFNAFAGSSEFNPIAIVFRRWRWPERYRFYRPFGAFKHGRPEEVERLVGKLVADLDALSQRRGRGPAIPE